MPLAHHPARLLAAMALAILALLTACSKSPEQVKAEKAAEVARTTGILLVQSNLAAATLKVTAGDGSIREAQPGQPLSALPAGRYTITATLDGWPERRAEATVTAGQTTELPLNFPSGSLRLDTVPAGAVVRLGKSNALGKTPLTIPQLPAGELSLSLEYPGWPPVPCKVAITDGQEAATTVRLPHGRLVVNSVPAGAIVVLDGKPYKQTPLFFDPVPAGAMKLTLQREGFPPLEVAVTITDGAETKIRPALATAFPLLDPAELLRSVWIPDDPSKITTGFNATTGIYRPKNDIVKNLHRERLYNRWQNKFYRYTGPVKSYDPASGRLEFAEQRSELARYRVLAQLDAGTKSPVPLQKDPKDKEPVVLTIYGRLTAVEEPAWPSRVITLEFAAADFVLADATP
ncbi:MAG: carboxypeptidase regulatory-like domain-containing protein [Verrucomicrobiota bacterium]